MAEPTTRKTIGDLVREVARYTGLAYYGSSGDDVAMAPTDRHDLDICKKIVNDGISMFVEDAPTRGWRWQKRIMAVSFVVTTTSTATSGTSTTLVDSDLAGTYDDDYYNNCIIEITAGTGKGETALVTDYTGSTGTFTFSGGLSGDSTPDTTTEYTIGHRYKLADDFGGSTEGRITYIRESNIGTPIDWASEALMRDLRENSNTSDYPQFAAVQPYDRRQWELIVWPDPSAVHVVQFPYSAYWDALEFECGIGTAAAATSITIGALANLYADDYFNGWTLTVVGGTGQNGTATVTDYTGSSGKVDFSGGLSTGVTPDTTSVVILEPVNRTHPAGFQFDDVIIAACKARAELEIEDLGSTWTNYYSSKGIPKAYERDARLAPRKLGKDVYGLKASRTVERTWKDVSFS